MYKQYIAYAQSPLGLVEITADEQYITSLRLLKSADKTLPADNPDELLPHIRQCIVELGEYFAGTRTDFTIPIKQNGTDFQQKVWQQLLKIPYGTTISYIELARRLGNSKLTRAVGGANHRNKLWIVVPCHRVIGADGSLTGYGGGLECKQWLLQHEAGNGAGIQKQIAYER
ncbi:MAG: methylated-DNA--[protein]-cysteine S-methyltransferase [Prevotellaceae bacterium]|jgi:methylated-DNA-[protein]-cysteine S-methyltransferase|nr:methylated-DNA--[protein]-cysteine S-methyltransferase [Prevotellaceae bacterium]